MIVVAKRLSEIAVNKNTAEDDADAFGRSAFNRYYYAAYLIIREMLSKLNPSWTKTKHRQIPDLLTGAMTNKIKAEVRKQTKASLIRPSKESLLLTETRKAAAGVGQFTGKCLHSALRGRL